MITLLLDLIKTVLILCLIASNVTLAAVLWLSVFTRNQRNDD